MSERVAIVAGAGGELGRATAEKLAATGLTVARFDRNQEALKELPDGIRPKRPTRPMRPRPAGSSTGAPPRSTRRTCW